MPHRPSNGFTLVELVMILVILGILAAMALPRFTDRQTFDNLSFFDQAKAAIRYGQKAAIAQRRNVFVNVTANSICLTYATDANCTGANPANHVLNPANNQWFRLVAPAGASFNTAGSFFFSPLGSPSLPATLSGNITGDGVTRTITIERDTGYVH